VFLFGLYNICESEQCIKNCHDTCVSSTVTGERKRKDCNAMRRLKVKKKSERKKRLKRKMRK
jgi:hypothetical protein